jgi:hypothetical protein
MPTPLLEVAEVRDLSFTPWSNCLLENVRCSDNQPQEILLNTYLQTRLRKKRIYAASAEDTERKKLYIKAVQKH